MSQSHNYRDPEGRDSALAIVMALLINAVAVAMVAASLASKSGRY